MIGFAGRRLARALVLLVVALAVVFIVLEFARAGAPRPDATDLGLGFAGWLGGAVIGNFGVSSSQGMSAGNAIAGALAVSAPLVLLGAAIGGLLGGACGVAAGYRASIGGRVVTVLAQLVEIVPTFWLASMLSLTFGLGLHWFAPVGFVPWAESPLGATLSLVLPALALGLAVAAPLTRIVRDAVARARAESPRLAGAARRLSADEAFHRYGRRRALIDIAKRLAPLVAALIAGSIMVEMAFSLPGLGRLLITAALARDVVLLRGGLLVLIVVVVVLQAVLRIIAGWIDPRIRRTAV